MNPSIIRSVLMFVAGAACATCASVIAGVTRGEPPPVTTRDLFEQQMAALLPQMASTGLRVLAIDKGTVIMSGAPPEACVTPPRPNLPYPAVNPVYLRQFQSAADAYNTAVIRGSAEPVRFVDKCWPAPQN